MGKDNRHRNPAWVANPMLAEVREAQGELRHIQRALQRLEQAAALPVANGSNEVFEGLLHSTAIRSWIASLNESFLAMAFLVQDPYSVMGPEDKATQYLKAELDKANMRWGGAIKRARNERLKNQQDSAAKLQNDRAAAAAGMDAAQAQRDVAMRQARGDHNRQVTDFKHDRYVADQKLKATILDDLSEIWRAKQMAQRIPK